MAGEGPSYGVDCAIDLISDKFRLFQLSGYCDTKPSLTHTSYAALAPAKLLLLDRGKRLPQQAQWWRICRFAMHLSGSHMNLNHIALLACLGATGCSIVPPSAAGPGLAKEQVMATERAFAKTMADRDPVAFASFIAQDTVFFSGPKPLRGKQAVVDFWARYYTGPTAPFSWEPREVEVLDSGDLAISSGPVYDPSGKQFATFTSVWRHEAPNAWRIVFDKGNPVCDCAKSQ